MDTTLAPTSTILSFSLMIPMNTLIHPLLIFSASTIITPTIILHLTQKSTTITIISFPRLAPVYFHLLLLQKTRNSVTTSRNRRRTITLIKMMRLIMLSFLQVHPMIALCLLMIKKPFFLLLDMVVMIQWTCLTLLYFMILSCMMIS